MQDSNLELKIRSDNLSFPTSVYLPDRKALNEALFPGARLPHMYEGRRWHEKVYSPFHSPSDPVEIIQVEVVSTDSIAYHGEMCEVMRVEYRGMGGSGISNNARLQAVSWVQREGTVLRHDVYIGGSEMRFERLSTGEAAEIGVEFFQQQLRQGAKID